MIDATTNWVLINAGRPPEGGIVLWIDDEGSYHLGSCKEDYLLPVTYGEADMVMRPLSGHRAWRHIYVPLDDQLSHPWVALTRSKPAQGAEVIWLDWDGGLHLARRKGRGVAPAVYGNAEDVILPIGQFRAYLEIVVPAETKVEPQI